MSARLDRIKDDYESALYGTTDGFENYLQQAISDLGYLLALALATREFMTDSAFETVSRRAFVLQHNERVAMSRPRTVPRELV